MTKDAFIKAGLLPFGPHSFRKTIGILANDHSCMRGFRTPVGTRNPSPKRLSIFGRPAPRSGHF
jgi:hypothetical protein